jgi:hypothetical protein
MLRVFILLGLSLAGCSTPPVARADLAKKSRPFQPPTTVAPCPAHQPVEVVAPLMSQQGLWKLMDYDELESSVFFPQSQGLEMALVQDPCHAKSAGTRLMVVLRDSSGVLDSLLMPIAPPTPVRHADGHDRMSELRADIKVRSVCGDPVEAWGRRIEALMAAQKAGPEMEPGDTWQKIKARRRALIRENLCPPGKRRTLVLQCVPRWGDDPLPEFRFDLDARRLVKGAP